MNWPNPIDNPASSSTIPKQNLRLWHFLYLTALFGTGIAVTPVSIWLTTIWLLYCWIMTRNVGLLGRLFGTMLFAWLTFGLFGPTLETPRGIARCMQCRNNQRQLIFAMNSYSNHNGNFPQASSKNGDSGMPPVSWRVQILPYLEQQPLYDQYDFSDPWDGPKNSKLASLMPDCFQCPECQSNGKTTYKLVTGPGTLFDGVTETRAKE